MEASVHARLDNSRCKSDEFIGDVAEFLVAAFAMFIISVSYG